MATDDYRHLTAEEGIEALDPRAKRVHTASAGPIAIGADWDREDVVEEIRKAADEGRLVEVPRESFAWGMDHRIAFLRHFRSGNSLVIETRDGYGD